MAITVRRPRCRFAIPAGESVGHHRAFRGQVVGVAVAYLQGHEKAFDVGRCVPPGYRRFSVATSCYGAGQGSA